MCARGRYGGEALLGASNNALFPSIKPETVAPAMTRGRGS
jgi:hypothetical protein